MTTCTAWVEYENGDRTEYPGLTRGRAIWRYHWLSRNSERKTSSGRPVSWGWQEDWETN